MRTKTKTMQHRLADQIDNLAEQTDGLRTEFAERAPSAADLRKEFAERAPKVRDQLKDHLPELSEDVFDKLPDSVSDRLPESVKPTKRSKLKKTAIAVAVAGAAGLAFVAARKGASGGANSQPAAPYVPTTAEPTAANVDGQTSPSSPRPA